jgi:hypothetical protein
MLRGRNLLFVLTGLAILSAGLYLWLNSARSGTSRIPERVSYNFHIRPILSDRCFKCHGPDGAQRKAGLRLDLEAGLFGALKESEEGFVIVPGKPRESDLYRRISSGDTADLMPPPSSHLALTEGEVGLIEEWIRQGAKYEKHWALIPPAPQPVPDDESGWSRNEIDQFVLAKMEEQGLTPNDEADRERLLRRLHLDLTGLPPTIEEQEAFLADDPETAYEQKVDELLASKHYGERMAIHWLDVARYADSHGYQDDGLRTMWPWRDWVIHAFNENYTYDKFLTWQLAGDLLPNLTKEMLLATGFNRNHKITQEGGVIDEEYRIEYVTDRTNTFGKAFLALTFECAKCHDHKYDPIPQRDYFRTFAFFNQVAEKGYQGDIFSGTAADPPRMRITTADVQSILTFINKKDTGDVKVMVMKDSSWHRPTHILKRGNYDAPTDVVEAGTPEAVLPFDTTKYAKNRLGLARWLLSEDHPLTARVFVNRIWQEFFGRGIVKTSGDFGMQGELPSHPELLDWLALNFINNGWNIKRLVRQIVMSATYRQSAGLSDKKQKSDPENVYLSRNSRVRIPAEITRDWVLGTAGLLNTEIGGPSVKPYQPKGIWEAATSGRGVLATYTQDHGEGLYRRGMYTFIKRTVPPPSMLVFDASSRDQCEVKRLRTNTPLQALVMLNDPTVNEAARVLAQKLVAVEPSETNRVGMAFRLILCRLATDGELDQLTSYYRSELELFSSRTPDAERLVSVGEFERPSGDTAAVAALMQTIVLIYNLDETLTRS